MEVKEQMHAAARARASAFARKADRENRWNARPIARQKRMAPNALPNLEYRRLDCFHLEWDQPEFL